MKSPAAKRAVLQGVLKRSFKICWFQVGFAGNLCLGQVEHGAGLWEFVLLLWPSHWLSRVPVMMSAMISAESRDFRIAGSKIHLIFRVDTNAKIVIRSYMILDFLFTVYMR